MRRVFLILLFPTVFSLLACTRESVVQAGKEDEKDDRIFAHAVIRDQDNKAIGMVNLSENASGVQLRLSVSSLSPGEHGFHIHDTAQCILPDFESAGGHFNPTGAQHGFKNPKGPHVGDMYSLLGSEEIVHVDRLIEGVTLSDGPLSLLSPAGKAIVIHAEPDDYATDPSGNSGARIACGIIERDR
jgi:superoxide dismutase, Cu-Zn family